MWTQPRPQSHNTHRPIILQLGKETIESLKLYGPVTKEMADLENRTMNVVVNGCSVQVTVKIRITALDRKAADAVTGLGGAFCDLCHMSPAQAHDPSKLEEEILMTRNLEDTRAIAATLAGPNGEVTVRQGDYNVRKGVVRAPTVEKDIESTQSLHLLLRTTDWLLKLTYHEIAEVAHWSEGSNMRDLGFIKQAKANVQAHMKEKTGLKIAFPDSAGTGGTTTTGNVCRRILFDSATRENLLELVPERKREQLRVILVRIAVSLRVVSSKSKLSESGS